MRNLERSWVLFLMLVTALVAALSVRYPLFFNLTYLFGAILSFSFLWAWLNLHWVRVTRHTRVKHVQVGKFFEEHFVVENTGPLPKLWLELKDYSDLPGHRSNRVVSNLRRKQQQSWHVRTLCYKRGRYTLGPVSLFSSDPFGLFLLKKDLPATFTSHVVVYPLAVDLPNFQPPIGEQTGGEAIRRRTHYVTPNISGIRQYAFGDSFNRIHWPSTARTGQLMVKEFEQDPMADVWIFLDMAKSVQVGVSYDEIRVPSLPEAPWEKLPAFELAPGSEEYGIAVVASISKYFLMQNRAVGLVTYANAYHREVAQSDRGERQLTRIYEMLAVTQAHGLVPLAELLAAETLRLSRNTTVMIITPDVDSAWVAAARHLIDRSIRVTAIIIDPGSFVPFGSSTLEVELLANHIPYYMVHQGDVLEQVLANVRAAGR